MYLQFSSSKELYASKKLLVPLAYRSPYYGPSITLVYQKKLTQGVKATQPSVLGSLELL